MMPDIKTSGVLPDSMIGELFAKGHIGAPSALEPGQIQPASLDLRLGVEALRLRASFLPNGARIEDRLSQDIVMHRMGLEAGAVLEKGCVYLVRLLEHLALPSHMAAKANPKSSTGRIDVFVRIIGDGGHAFDELPAGYHGPLYAEISPCTFSILARTGDRLAQMRFHQVPDPSPIVKRHETRFSVGLAQTQHPVGFRARPHAAIIDLRDIGRHDPHEFWEPLHAPKGRIVLDPGAFYILASAENVSVPEDQAAEMRSIQTELGEFRAHYAGFFDPGFGVAQPSKAVLEVRARDVPFILEHGQPVGRLVFEPMVKRPEQIYGGASSHYQGQALQLSKHFSPWTD